MISKHMEKFSQLLQVMLQIVIETTLRKDSPGSLSGVWSNLYILDLVTKITTACDT